MSPHNSNVQGHTMPNGVSYPSESPCQLHDHSNDFTPVERVNGEPVTDLEGPSLMNPQSNGVSEKSGCRNGSSANIQKISSAVKGNGNTPIAICGMAMRLPGGISTSPQLWEFLLNKRDARGRVPQSRYNASAFHDPTGKPGTIISEHGYFLEDDLSRLDASFFNMVRVEVERLDPQQRLMLEVARECFEDAGVTGWKGRPIGCYMGSLGEDWCEMFARETQNWGNYRISGYGDFLLSNRVSYEMDLQGPRFAIPLRRVSAMLKPPSVTTRTACSASLVALHEACAAVSRGDCEAALVGGANLIMTPGTTMSMTEQGVLSKDGSCKTFSADADGYVRGEAIAALYIKPLDDALRDGNPIRAIIRSTAINHDGKTPGLTVPSSSAQETLIRKAYQTAGIADISRTAYVECHGTGTPVGDPIEGNAVARVFGGHGVYIGSVKPNLGHAEGASGLVSVMKTILALENRTIPPNIKFSRPNPAIPFDSAKLIVPTEAKAWPSECLERASINSFGVGGTNAHVVLDSAAGFTLNRPPKILGEPQLLLFSSNTPNSLSRTIQNHRDYVERNPAHLKDLAYTLANRREHSAYRGFGIATDDTVNTSYPTARSLQTSSVVMIFTGQGAQWPQMGRELLDSNPTFRNSIRNLDNILQVSLKDTPAWTIEEQLRNKAIKAHINSAEVSQLLCAAVQIALVDTFASLEVRPCAVVGHSSGEIAAAYAAGAITAEEAILVAKYRGSICSALRKPGLMAAVGLGADQVQRYLVSNVNVACDNSPESVTISGDVDGVELVIAEIHRKQPGVLARKLQVETAYHSSHMADVGPQYEALIERVLNPKEPAIPFFSTVTGSLLTAGPLGSGYWRRNLESPVLFRTAIACMHQHGFTENAVFLEIGPHSALAGPLRQNMAELSTKVPYVSALVRNEDCKLTFLAALGKLYTFGVHLDLQALMPTGSCLSDLPRYPWDHEECYWYESRLSKQHRQREYPHHDLLGSRVLETSDLEPSWRNLLHLDSADWLRDHKILHDIVFPFSGYVAMAGEAARQLSKIDETFHLRHVIVSTALVVNEGKPTEMITTLRRQRLTDTLDSQWWDFSISSYNGATWTKHCKGAVLAQSGGSGRIPRLSEPETLPRKLSSRKWIRTLQRGGFDLGPAFRNLEDISASTTNRKALATVVNNRHEQSTKYHLHPTVIDNALQLVSVAFVKGQARDYKGRLPVSCDHIEVTRSESNLVVESTANANGDAALGEIRGIADGVSVLIMSGLRLLAIDNTDTLEMRDTHAAARLVWGPDIDFADVKELIRPSVDLSTYTPILENLYQMCLLHTQRTKDSSIIEEHHLRLFDNWIENHSESLGTSSLENLDSEHIPKRIESLVNDLAGTPAASAAIALQNVCYNIDAIYSGHTSSVEALLTDEDITGLYRLLDHCDLSPFIQRIGHCKPNLRVLEIGSWRNQPSGQILNSLRLQDGQFLCSKYTYTSPNFVPPRKYETEVSVVNHSSLDIEEDPVAQGFESHQFDLVIANKTIHTARSISKSLNNIKKLLSPDGYLLLQELCPVSKWINFIFGIDSSWWRGSADGRLGDPYLDTQGWQHELSAAGFDNSDAEILDSNEPFHLNTINIVKPAIANPPSNRVSLLCQHESQDVGGISNLLEGQGYSVVKCTLRDSPSPGSDVIALLDVEEPFFESIDDDAFSSIKTFLRGLDNSGILWVTKSSQFHCRDPRYAQVIGAARSIRSELLIDLATCEVDNIDQSTAQIVQIFSKFRKRATTDSLKPDLEYSVHEGLIRVGRFYPFPLCDELLDLDPESGAKLDIEVPGRLGTLYWTRQPALPPLQPEEVEIEMYSVSLNFRDVLVAMKIVELRERVLGLEGAGVVRRVGSGVKGLHVGDRVATIERGAFSTILRTLEILCVKVPDGFDINEASTILLPYVTAMHSLQTVGGLKAGQSVLIHSACGGVGIAAVRVAHMVGAEVYITVGTEEKVRYAMQDFKIPRHRIFNSRDESFADGIMRETQGHGVDVVLNSLSGELLHATWRCVSPFGKLIEIGKRDLIGSGKLDMKPFLANRSYCCIDIDAFRDRPGVIHQTLKSISELLETGEVTPIPTKVFNARSICDSFRYMQRGQHIGRICVSLRDTPDVSNLEGEVRGRPRSPKLNSSASYLLVGGLGGLGRAVSVWMVENGARYLIFLSPNAGNKPEVELFIKELNSMGCQVQICRGSVADLEDVTKAVLGATRPLKGILQMSMVLRDESFLSMSLDQWNAAVRPKVQGTWNLHNATVSADSSLDFFIMFSSLSGIIGQPGQANYASANTFLDAFVQYRVNLGLAASAIDLGAVGDIGYISGKQHLMQTMSASGFKALSEREVLDAVALAMTAKKPASNPFKDSGADFASQDAFVIGLASSIPLRSAANRAVWRNDRRMAIYHNTKGGDDVSGTSNADLKGFIASAKADISLLQTPDAGKVLGAEIGKRLCNLLMKPEEDLNTSLSLSDLGMDSLVGIELRAWWKQVFGFDISVLEMLGKGTLEVLGQHAADGLAKAIQLDQGGWGMDADKSAWASDDGNDGVYDEMSVKQFANMDFGLQHHHSTA